jgi:uncharacterized membrane protein YkvA (DUF1232 family)
MPLTVRLEISDLELEHFRSALEAARGRVSRAAPQEIAATAREAAARLDAGETSPFVKRRLQKVRALAGMLDDPEWQLPEPERRRVLQGLAYVAEAHDLVPDNVPVLGLLDDAIMLELVLHDLRHELEGYEDFDEFRRHERAKPGAAGQHVVSREDWLDARRRALQERIRERRERDVEEHGGGWPLITHF